MSIALLTLTWNFDWKTFTHRWSKQSVVGCHLVHHLNKIWKRRNVSYTKRDWNLNSSKRTTRRKNIHDLNSTHHIVIPIAVRSISIRHNLPQHNSKTPYVTCCCEATVFIGFGRCPTNGNFTSLKRAMSVLWELSAVDNRRTAQAVLGVLATPDIFRVKKARGSKGERGWIPWCFIS